MAGRGYDVDLVLSKAEGHYLPEISGDVRVVDLGAGRVLASLPGLVRYLRRERPSAMLTSLCHVNVVGLWARRVAGVGTTLVVNEQNTFSLETRNSPRRRHRWPRPHEALLSVGRRDRRRLAGGRRGPGPDRGYRAGSDPGGLQPDRDPGAAEDGRQADRPCLVRAGGAAVFLAVGRLAPQKDFPTLIRAFAQVRARHEARLLILGGGPERAHLQSLVGELGLDADVGLPGWVTNPYPYMVRSAAFVLSSRWEGLPSVLIEALYCGVPVIATDCPSGGRWRSSRGQARDARAGRRRGRARPRHGGGHRRPDPSPHRGAS